METVPFLVAFVFMHPYQSERISKKMVVLVHVNGPRWPRLVAGKILIYIYKLYILGEIDIERESGET